MCNFASFVLTKYDEYYLNGSDSHENIIEYYNLRDNIYNIEIVRVELIPPDNEEDFQDLSQWEFKVDQDEYPDWTYEGDPTLEEKARKALARRIEEQKIGKKITVADYKIAIGGEYSNIVSGNRSIAIGLDHAEIISGDGGISIIRNDGSIETEGGYSIANSNNKINIGIDTALIGDNLNLVTAKDGSMLLLGSDNEIKINSLCYLTAYSFNKIEADYGCRIAVDDHNTITAGTCSEIFADKRNTITVGANSRVFAGLNSKVKAGIKSIICIHGQDENQKMQVATGIIGEDGLEPNVFYCLKNGKLEKVEEEQS